MTHNDAHPRPPLALTMGDPAGIGPELTEKAWNRRHDDDLPAFYVIGDPTLYGSTRLAVINDPAEAADAFPEALPVYPIELATPTHAGEADSRNAPAVLSSIQHAVLHCQDGLSSGLVTNPIAKHVLMEAGFSHPGHTEYLAELAGVARTVMMLSGGGLRCVPVTIHCALKDVFGQLTIDAIVETTRITAEGLQAFTGGRRPRLAVAGLNPHAGEEGRFGDEDEVIIRPAIEMLQKMGIDVTGPHPADTMFHEERRAEYDAAICMYHDQALIPVKTLDFHGGVNITLGMPFIRTSPDHGTAFGIAGQNQARPDSLIAALKTADAMCLSPDRTTAQ